MFEVLGNKKALDDKIRAAPRKIFFDKPDFKTIKEQFLNEVETEYLERADSAAKKMVLTTSGPSGEKCNFYAHERKPYFDGRAKDTVVGI